MCIDGFNHATNDEDERGKCKSILATKFRDDRPNEQTSNESTSLLQRDGETLRKSILLRSVSKVILETREK